MIEGSCYKIKLKDKIKNKERLFLSDKAPTIEYNCILINVFAIIMYREEYFPCERFEIASVDKINDLKEI